MINSIWIGLLFAGAALMKAYGRQWEHALTRAFVAATYLWIGWFTPSIDAARIFSRYFVFLLAAVEVISWSVIRYRSWKSKS